MAQDSSFLEFLEKLLLGLVQGVTEVFPVSSSGHLAVASKLVEDIFGLEYFSFKLAVYFHFGTFIAILLFYQRDVLGLWHSAVASFVRTIGRPLKRSRNRAAQGLGEKTPFLLLLSLSLTGILGIALRRAVREAFDDPLLIGCSLVANGLIVFVTGLRGSGSRRIRDLGAWDYLIVGVAQGLAVFPGLSRFGFTLCAGLWLKMEWFESLKLSFLLSLPTVLAAGLLELIPDIPNLQISLVGAAGTAAGVVAATAGGWLAIKVLLKQSLHAHRRLVNFGIYCIVLGVFAVAYFLMF
jgi:undecaprenyl-diphosphatase